MNPPGFTYIPGESRDRHGHLHFVIAEPTLFAQLAVANFTTPYDPCDRSCVVEREEHAWITRQTIVAYDLAHMVDVDEFEKRIVDGIYVPYGHPLSPELLARIQKGALDSPHTIKKVKDAVRSTLEGEKE